MQLIRLGDFRGMNLDMLVSWEIEAPPEPEPAPNPEPEPAPNPEPTPGGATVPVATTATVMAAPVAPVAPEPVEAPEPPPVRMTLTLASGGAFQTLTLEGQEAETMRAYLQGKSGALIR